MACSLQWYANLVCSAFNAVAHNIQSGNKQQERASGRTCHGCRSVRGYASAAGITLVRQSFQALRCT